MTLISGAILTIVLMVKEVIILGGFNQIDGGAFPSFYFGGVVQKEAWGAHEGMEHKSNTWMTYL